MHKPIKWVLFLIIPVSCMLVAFAVSRVHRAANSEATKLISAKLVEKAASKVPIADVSTPDVWSSLSPRPKVPSLVSPVDIASIGSGTSSLTPTVDLSAGMDVSRPLDKNEGSAQGSQDRGIYLPIASLDDETAEKDADYIGAMGGITGDRKSSRVQTRPPPMEMKRIQDGEETVQSSITGGIATTKVDATIHLDADFECGTSITVEQKSATHFLVTLNNQTDLRDWFMFRITGAVGKIIRVDLRGGDANGTKWTSLNPVYSNAANSNNNIVKDAEPSKADHGKDVRAWNGSLLPPMDGQPWRFVDNCWVSDANTFSFVLPIDTQSTYVAMRIPRPPSYNEQFLKQLAGNPFVEVIEVGKSQLGHPLQIVKIRSGNGDSEMQKPCVLVYAGEHADEHDSMWAAQGVIEYLAGDTVEARGLRQQLSVLVIPIFDPDSCFNGVHSGTIVRFLSTNETYDSEAYANWFQAWVNAGNRLDIVFDLHNVQSNEQPHISCFEMEGVGVRGKASAALHAVILKNFQSAGYLTAARPSNRGWSPDRLGGWLSRRYGPITFLYELNCQAPARHLTVQQLKEAGIVFVRSVPAFWESESGLALKTDVDARRRDRLIRWSKYTGAVPSNAIDAEAVISKGVGRTSGSGDLLVEQWIN